MELDLRRLRMLREVARRGGVTAAAHALHYSPSGVSQQLTALEADVGAPILERVGRGIRLTDVGRVLAEHAEVVLSAVYRAEAAVEQVRDTLAADLVMGVFASVSAGLVPTVIGLLAQHHPGIRLTTRETDLENAAVDLRHGHLDLAFLIDYPHAPEPWPSGLRTVAVGTEDLHLAAPAGAFVGTPVDLADLASHEWIISGPHTYYGRAVRAACRRAGFDPTITHQVDESATALAMVSAGAGITPLVSDLGRVFRFDGVEIIPMAAPVKRNLVVAHHPEATRRPAVQAVLDTIVDAAATLGLRRYEQERQSGVVRPSN